MRPQDATGARLESGGTGKGRLCRWKAIAGV
jgi:hypothetical protein